MKISNGEIQTQSVPGWQSGPCVTEGCVGTARWINVEANRTYTGRRSHYMCTECCEAIQHLTVRDSQMGLLYWAVANRGDLFLMIDNAADCTEAIELTMSTELYYQLNVEHYHGGYLVQLFKDGECTEVGQTQQAWVAAEIILAVLREYHKVAIS